MVRRMTEQERAALEAEFLEKARAEFRRTFSEELRPKMCTFTEKETRCFDAGDSLGRFLLKAQVQEEETARPVKDFPCPDCGGPTLAGEDEPPPEREVVTRRGAVRLARPERACPACRRALFPPRP